MVGKAQVPLLVQGEVARPGVPYAVFGLYGEEAPAVVVDGKVQGHTGFIEAALGIVGIELRGHGGIATLPDIRISLVFIAHQTVHHLVEGLPGKGVHLKAGGGDVCHIVGDHIQVLAVGDHP